MKQALFPLTKRANEFGRTTSPRGSYDRDYLNTLISLKRVLTMYANKPLVIVSEGLDVGGPLRGLDWSIGMRSSARGIRLRGSSDISRRKQ